MIPMVFDLGMAIKVLVLVMASLLVACGNNMSNLSDDELREKVYVCDYALNLSPSDAIVCGNYHRECKRRLKDESRFVCN